VKGLKLVVTAVCCMPK